MRSVNPNGVGLAKRLLSHRLHFLSEKENRGQVGSRLANFIAPILAPIWTPFVDCQFSEIFMERTIHAQLDQ